MADFVRSRYNHPTLSSRKRAGTTTAVAITNQDFQVILDTGSSDLWLASTNCASCPSAAPQYSPPVSASSGGSPVTIQYGSGAVEGDLAVDTVTWAGYTVQSQTLLAVTQLTSGLLSGSVSGILGLAYQALASTNAVPLWQALTNAGDWTAPEMSFYLTRYINDFSASANEPGGVLTLGGTNTSLYSGAIEYQNMPSSNDNTYWLLEVSAITAQGSNIAVATGANAVAAIDTGTTLIGGPTADVKKIYAAVPGAVALTGQMEGYWGFPPAPVAGTGGAGGASSPAGTPTG
ncbi:hypothetical protein HWV62_31531 [Athelia sp. TMB]|nr:hypothetical protein HWV62_31531 [Athelia sp. TMB]